mmetsp:Transcript_2245/g.3581  ORF Transcript_2245/g.3581 Transcript_2245/m.3581 type:complete len:369 (-) Transcript_2245:502-1608(-)|eukprot:jgi/Bigna1/66874/fgenesh1_pg.2_\
MTKKGDNGVLPSHQPVPRDAKKTLSVGLMGVFTTCTAYISSCIGMSCFQKMAIMAFPRRNVLICIQASFVLVFLLSLRWKQIHLGPYSDFLRFLPICLCFTLMLMASMLAYQFCTLGTIVVIGALCPLLTLPVEMFAFKENPLIVTKHTVGSMVITVVGVAMYGMFQGKLRGQLIGISAMVGKTIINVYYQTRMRYLMVEDPVDINDEGMMLYNNGIALIATMITVFVLSEHEGLTSDAQDLSQKEWSWVLGSCVCCYAISYFSFRCQRLVSATSFHILGNVAKIVVVLFGWVVLQESYNLKSAFAVAIALIGAGWYSYDRVMTGPEKDLNISDDNAHLTPFIKARSGSFTKGLSKLGPSAYKYQSFG